MKITFRIHYNTKWGERIALVANHKDLGQSDIKKALFLDWTEGGFWTLSKDIEHLKSPLNYRYYLLNDAHEILDEEFGQERQLSFSKTMPQDIRLDDTWRNSKHPQNSLFTSAFSEAIFQQKKHKASSIRRTKTKGSVIFRLTAPRVQKHEQVVLCGSTNPLGEWDSSKLIFLENSDYPLWQSAPIPTDNQSFVEYKYGIYDTKEKRLLYLEAGQNRSIRHLDLPEVGQQLVRSDEYFNYPQGKWKGVGVAVPVFSLRSEKSLGVGEFTDIKGLVDWSKKVGIKMVQILPVNDTHVDGHWRDSYPYRAISVFALHPQYLNVSELPGFKQAIKAADYKKLQIQLNAESAVDYEAVVKNKLHISRQAWQKTKDKVLKDTDFQRFIEENAHWLKPYAAFCYLRDKEGTAVFSEWKKHKPITVAALKKLTAPQAAHFDEIAYWYFIQYYLDLQLKTASDYARAQGIILKGDIAIGIGRESADAWLSPELFNMNGQSGAPPDPFAANGQNWGFPTYNWERMAEDGFQWWKNRFTQLSRYFDAFRIDHILGFFRIWQIPLEQIDGSFGFFNPAIPINRREFAEHGIWFDYDRFCKPYIREHLLNELFGAEALDVFKTFMERDKIGSVYFKKQFTTQRQLAEYLAKHTELAHLKERLLDLQANVLFFEVEGSKGTEFHPRIEFLSRSSFQEMPPDTKPRLEALYNDYFYHRQEEFWRESAMRKLPAIRQATNMLICGEDLGMVPACVPGVMDELSILTLEIQRMSKNPETEFLQEADIPYLSVASPSTHDMSPIRLWWEEMENAQRQRFYNKELHLHGEAPTRCTPEVAKRILQQHLHWRSMWIVLPLQDILAIAPSLRRENPMDERINVPANPEHYWQFRFHVSNEELLSADEFNEDVERMIMVAGR